MERGPFWIRLWIMIIKDRCIALQHKCLLWFFYLIVNCTWFIYQSVQCLYRFVWMISKNFFLSIFLCEIFNVHNIRIRLRIVMTRSPTRQRFLWATIPLTRALLRSNFYTRGLSYHDLFMNHDEWRLRDSNSRPPACKAGALPTELSPHLNLAATYFPMPSPA